ncbi:FAD-dependent oxidoreductase [Phormidium sp. LEGE 05292]|uniref:FAD-dependent oxidoreductase n=1 Tax=[Phormidium] sp. LEGE 05292 TaxID=767427 RepID=UPI0018803C8D|nr:FAD-dependent oxidoreductase [Phormidium sp. LEGE 05292]MBE9228336.1 FAD-dependent oxidoreductase [Phormidium sp. LEGE 05292]
MTPNSISGQESSTKEHEQTSHYIIDDVQVDCCIVGGGPAGAVLSLLLARQGIAVMLLEAHRDFDRDFRGDTLQPSAMEIMAQMGLADRLLQLPHTKLQSVTLRGIDGKIIFSPSFSGLKTDFPYVTVMPQVRFLDFIVAEAKQYPSFQLVLGANVQELIEEDGVIRGVRYRGHGGWHEVRAQVTIGADGRHSRLRELAGLKAIPTSAPMDVLWFRLPRLPFDPEGLNGRVGQGRMVILLDRSEQWQIGYIIPKGEYQQVRKAGLETLRQHIVEILPEFQERVQQLQDWHQIAFLSVESSYVRRWYRPGLLLIGDAAHVMSPVGGVGINYAIQDAVVTANHLSQPLKNKQVKVSDLAAVQRQRQLPTRFIQFFQSLVQQNLIQSALNNQPLQLPAFLKMPILRDIPPRIIGFGLFPPHVEC